MILGRMAWPRDFGVDQPRTWLLLSTTILTVGVWLELLSPGFLDDDPAAWAQAIGSVAAIGAAIAIDRRTARRQAEHQVSAQSERLSGYRNMAAMAVRLVDGLNPDGPFEEVRPHFLTNVRTAGRVPLELVSPPELVKPFASIAHYVAELHFWIYERNYAPPSLRSQIEKIQPLIKADLDRIDTALRSDPLVEFFKDDQGEEWARLRRSTSAVASAKAQPQDRHSRRTTAFTVEGSPTPGS